MTSNLRKAHLPWTLGVALLCGCATGRPERATDPAPARPVVSDALPKPLPVGDIGYDFQWRQRVTAVWSGGQRSFDAVLSRDGDLLQLIGLGPMGKVGFVIRVRDDQPIEVEHHPSLSFAFDPRHVLLDVQRAFYPWLAGIPPKNGPRTGVRQGESISETWKEGRLLAREFRSSAGDPGIHIRYEKQGVDDDVAERTVLTNDRLGYWLKIETLDQTRL